MGNLFRQDGFIGWVPRVDDVNADPGILVRADNLLVDEKGALTLRPGSELAYSVSGQVNKIHSAILHPGGVSTQVDIVAAGVDIYHGNTAIGQVGASPKGYDVAIGADLWDAFIAGGSQKFRYDGETSHSWGLSRPPTAPTLNVSSPIAATVSNCSSTEVSGAFAANEGTGSFAAGYDGTANAAFKIIPDAASGRAVGTKAFATAQDFFTILTYPGGDDDLIDFYIYMEQPEKIKTFEVIFAVGADTDPFQTDTYNFTFEINEDVPVKKRSKKRADDAALDEGLDDVPTPQDVDNDRRIRENEPENRIPDDIELRGPRYKLPTYAESASPAWTHLSVPRGSFERKGSTNGKNWTTVKAVRFVAQFVPGATGELRVDEIKIFGGGSRAFTGDYRCRLQAIAKRTDGTIIAKSPVSDPSSEVRAFQQSLTVTIPYSTFQSLDPSVTELWLYLSGGGLDDWYRIASFPANPYAAGVALDEFDPNPEGTIDQDDRARGMSRDFSWPADAGNPDLTVTLAKSEIDALIENVRADRGLRGIPDNIMDIAGPFQFRMALLDEDGVVWFTGINQPGTVSVYHSRVTDPEPLWLEQTSSGLYVGTRQDVYRVYGDGSILDPYNINFAVRALGVPHPPVDGCVWAYGDAVIYRSADGLVTLTGDTVQMFPIDDIEPLWRGIARNEFSPLNTYTGRFRLVVDNQILYMLAPEGEEVTDDTIYRYSFITRRWSRTYYPWDLSALSVDAAGGAMVGTVDGKVLYLDVSSQDNLQNIEYEVWTRYDSDGNPLIIKDAFDLQVAMDTGGLPTTVSLVKEDGTTKVDYTASTSNYDIWRANAADFGPFQAAQVRISGASYKFVLRHYDLSYRSRPQHMMMLDTGYVAATKQGDLAWFKELEITCKSDSDLIVTPYYDDVAAAERTVTVTPGVVTTYRVLLPKGSVGYKARFKVYTTAADGTGSRGFECYSIRMRIAPSGNVTTSSLVPVYPMSKG